MEIHTQNLSLTYPNGKQALNGITLDLRSPSLVGLLGPNGAGKTTLMKLLSAALLPSSGFIEINGHRLPDSERMLKHNLGYLPQDFGLFDELTVTEFLDYMSALKGLRRPKDIIRETILTVNLGDKAKSKIGSLSGGQRQRVGIAQALLGDPSFMILDEPTVGLDPEERMHFRNLFSQKAQDRLVLLSTHIIEDVQSVCDTIVIINHGKLLFIGTPEELILRAQGHVGTFSEKNSRMKDGIVITARINKAGGVSCRGIAKELPDYAEPDEPTLEDAYLYMLLEEAEQ